MESRVSPLLRPYLSLFILLPDTGIETPEALRGMIYEVNSTYLAPEEVLSDNLYYYDYREKKVKIIY